MVCFWGYVYIYIYMYVFMYFLPCIFGSIYCIALYIRFSLELTFTYIHLFHNSLDIHSYITCIIVTHQQKTWLVLLEFKPKIVGPPLQILAGKGSEGSPTTNIILLASQAPSSGHLIRVCVQVRKPKFYLTVNFEGVSGWFLAK